MNISKNDDDEILDYIEISWSQKSLEKDWKSCAKLLRLFVNHVKTPEGIPLIHQKDTRDKAQTLLDAINSMELDAASQCVSSIDHAQRYLDSTHSFGAGFRSTLQPEELKAIQRKYRRVKCRATGSESVEP
jgi:hypothetical protein